MYNLFKLQKHDAFYKSREGGKCSIKCFNADKIKIKDKKVFILKKIYNLRKNTIQYREKIIKESRL